MNKYNLDYAIYTKNNDSIEKILNSTSSLILKAKCLASMGQVSESIKILDYLDLDLMTVPEKQQFFESRLLIASQSKDYEQGFRLAEKIINDFPDSFVGQFEIALLYKRVKQWELSLVHINRSIELLPNFDYLHFEAASLEVKLKRTREIYIHQTFIKNRAQKILLYLESHIITRVLIFPTTLLFLLVIKNPYLIVGLLMFTLGFWFSSRTKGNILLESLLSKIIIGFGLYYIGFIIIYNISIHN